MNTKHYTAVGLSGRGKAGREAQRAARKELSRRQAAAKHARRNAIQAEKEVERWASEIPKAGEKRRGGMQMPIATKLLSHRETSRNLAALYPFIADGGIGVPGAFIGTDAYSGEPFAFDPWNLYSAGVISNPNGVIFGEIGGGKSSTAKTMVLRSLLFGRKATTASDPKGEWTPLTQAVGGSAIHLAQGGSARMNLLDAGHRPARGPNGHALTDTQWEAMVRSSRISLVTTIVNTLLQREVDPVEQAALDHAIDHVVKVSNNNPRLPELVTQLLDPDPRTIIPPGIRDHEHLAELGRQPGQTLRRLTGGDLAGLFDDYSTVKFDLNAPMATVDLSALGPGHGGIHIAQTITSAWVEAAVRDPHGGKRWIIYDEGWSMFESAPLLARMREQWKLSRAWGLSNWLIAHRATDIDAAGEQGSQVRGLAKGLLEDTDIRVMHRHGHDLAKQIAHTTGMSEAETDILANLAQGVALWRIKGRPAVVRTTLTDYELRLFDTDTRMTA